MTTVLQYLVVAAVIGLVVFGIAVFVFGRGEQLAALSPRVSPTELPDTQITPDDVRKVRFAMALRGYRMSDVDWALDRMAGELERLRTEVADLSGAGVDPGSATGSGPPAEAAEVLIGVSATPGANESRPLFDPGSSDPSRLTPSSGDQT
ncbi:MAG: DivIVA domain-containing protein [Nakamurella sp.]